MQPVLKDLLFKAGFTGSDLSNTQPGTCHETAFQNLFELLVDECGLYADMYMREVALKEINPLKTTCQEFLQQALVRGTHVTE